jgi:hypothetical protein
LIPAPPDRATGAGQRHTGVTALLRRRFELDHPEIAVLLLPRKVA